MHKIKNYLSTTYETCTSRVHIRDNMHRKNKILCTLWNTCTDTAHRAGMDRIGRIRRVGRAPTRGTEATG